MLTTYDSVSSLEHLGLEVLVLFVEEDGVFVEVRAYD